MQIWKEEPNAPKAPCRRDCKDRSVDPNCHMICERYLKYKADYEAYTNKIREAKHMRDDIYWYTRQRKSSRRMEDDRGKIKTD